MPGDEPQPGAALGAFPLAVSQCDTGVSQHNGDLEGQPSNAAFKNYQTEFLRDAANLRNGNGNRRSVALRIDAAIVGLLQHLNTADDLHRARLLQHVRKFVEEVHNPLQSSYAVDLDQTPLVLYYKHLVELYNSLILQQTVVAN